MSVDMISREVQKIKKKYKETDPFRLCRAMGILVLYTPMGSGNKCCKGFYLSQSRKRAVTINSDMSPVYQRIIIAHELGHAILHTKSSGIKAFHDFYVFDTISHMEYEANIFAADLLMDDADVLELLKSDIRFYEAASRLNVLPELLDFKFRVLKQKGYKITGSPVVSDGTFLKNIETGSYGANDR